MIWLWFVLSGIVTALPMFLFSDSLSALPLIVMCFANYLAPTFNLICGLVLGEVFTKTQIVSLVFFIAAIIMFSYSQFNTGKKA